PMVVLPQPREPTRTMARIRLLSGLAGRTQDLPSCACDAQRLRPGVWACSRRRGADPVRVMASLLKSGQTLAGYEIIEQVGKGGMGEVYRARQVSMDRMVALKILSPKLVAKDPAFTERFVAEARAAGRLNHANI